jgi:arylsulfatase A-like enzyme
MRSARQFASTLLVACACASATGCAAPAPAASPQIGRAHPVITIVIDQMGAWMADERWQLLPQGGGFARLMREGTLVKDMRYAHAVTDTAPGHSALYTGSPPRGSGICINDVLDPGGHKVSILRDERTALVGAEGRLQGKAGSSLAVLGVETLADRLRAAHPDALIVSLSLKDRGALFGGGRRPTASLWLDVRSGQMVCSTAFCQELPAWARALGSAAALGRRRAEVWTLLDRPWVEAHAATPDAQDGEGDASGLGVTFPHALAGTEPFARALRTTPMADELLVELALAALDAEARPGRPTLLALSLSANDYIGHTFGPDSWESWDELAHLDRSLGSLLARLDQRFGADGHDVLLTADHGVTTMPEAALRPATRPWCAQPPVRPDRWGRACGPVTRILTEELGRELQGVARSAMGEGAWVLGVDDPYVFLTSEARALAPSRQGALKAALTSALQAHREIARVFDVAALPSTCPPDADESLPALVCRSTSGASGDLYIVTNPGSFFDPDVVVGKGSSHGSPYLYDRAVPLLVRAPGRVVAHDVIDSPVGFGTFARTAATLLGIDPPVAARGARDLATR